MAIHSVLEMLPQTTTASRLIASTRSTRSTPVPRVVGLAIVVLFAWRIPCAAAEPMRVLFIGNSYTRFNDLPAMVQAIATSARRQRPEVAMHAPGGCTLKKHLSEKRTST